MNLATNQEIYLKRKEYNNNSPAFDWIFCCTSKNQVSDCDPLTNKNSIPIKKKPLRHKTRRFEKSFTKDSQKINGKVELGYKTQRKSESSYNETPIKLKLHESDLYQRHTQIQSLKPKRNCIVKFSYAMPKMQQSVLIAQSNPNEANLNIDMSNMDTKESFRNTNMAVSEKKNESQQNEAYFLKNTNTSMYTDEVPSPLSLLQKKSSKSVDKRLGRKLKNANSKDARFSLKMRQVVSIREPQADSDDHESIVIEGSDDGLFQFLVPIRQIEKESRIDNL